MSELQDPFGVVTAFESEADRGLIYSLPALEEAGLGEISRLPVSIRILLESVLRNCDGRRATVEDVRSLAAWKADQSSRREVPFVVSRVLLHDFTGIPLLVDLAAMRQAMDQLGYDPSLVEPLVPVDLVVDHSIQVDRSGTPEAFTANLKIEFARNRERYQFLKWGQQAFETLRVLPPSMGIVHQVNLEFLAQGVFSTQCNGTDLFYPDTLVGTDSHTPMINGLGIVGWGVGGIEAEAGMLGQPVYILAPDVVGVHLTGDLREGVTATDLTLRITQLLRESGVVGKFVEFFGDGAAALSVADRATVANMAPEYGATMGYFPMDENTLEYLALTGRTDRQVRLVHDYYQAQGLFGMPRLDELRYSTRIDLDLESIVPSVAGPKRPQDRIDLPSLKETFHQLLRRSRKDGGFEISLEERSKRVSVSLNGAGGDGIAGTTEIGHGSVLIAAITSCTNTSNPSVMVAAGLLARNARRRGLTIDRSIKTSLAPGSRVVTEYLEKTGLQEYLDQLGFNLVGYGCTTCIGNSGPLVRSIDTAIHESQLVAASVLSGNRNFEARVHSSIKANFLMSPPLVVAFALAGRVDIDLDHEPLGKGTDGKPVFLRDIWPTQSEIRSEVQRGLAPEIFHRRYGDVLKVNPQWNDISGAEGVLYKWDPASTYIQSPPFFEGFEKVPGNIVELHGMRCLAIVGESVTTDHISPAGAIQRDTPAGEYLLERKVLPKDFNTFGSRRGNDRIMTRGTFGNVRFQNLMADGKEGGWTKLMPEGELMTVFRACEIYGQRGNPLIVFAGNDYGMGSSRDWAAKGVGLLGVKAVVANSFERIHRSNLIGMGILPLQFGEGASSESFNLNGSERYSILGIDNDLEPLQEVTLRIERADGAVDETGLQVRIDSPIEIAYYRHGGILPYVLRAIIEAASS